MIKNRARNLLKMPIDCCLIFCFTALQRHYAVLQALALDEDEMPDVKDETLPDEEGFAR